MIRKLISPKNITLNNYNKFNCNKNKFICIKNLNNIENSKCSCIGNYLQNKNKLNLRTCKNIPIKQKRAFSYKNITKIKNNKNCEDRMNNIDNTLNTIERALLNNLLNLKNSISNIEVCNQKNENKMNILTQDKKLNNISSFDIFNFHRVKEKNKNNKYIIIKSQESSKRNKKQMSKLLFSQKTFRIEKMNLSLNSSKTLSIKNIENSKINTNHNLQFNFERLYKSPNNLKMLPLNNIYNEKQITKEKNGIIQINKSIKHLIPQYRKSK